MCCCRRSDPRRLVYLGSPALAVPPLRALVAAGHEVALVVSRPDTRRGRGASPTPSPVKAAALRARPARPPTGRRRGRRRRRPGRGGRLRAARSGRAVLDRLALVNLHFSLLPRWRGAAPVERAILAGDRRTGVCLMGLEETLDTGGVYRRAEVDIGPDETLDSSRARLVDAGHRAAARRAGPGLRPAPDRRTASHLRGQGRAGRAGSSTGPARRVDLPRIVRLGRAWTTFRGRRLLVRRARLPGAGRRQPLPSPPPPRPGHWSTARSVVTAGTAGSELDEVQPEGRGRQPAAEWLARGAARSRASGSADEPAAAPPRERQPTAPGGGAVAASPSARWCASSERGAYANLVAPGPARAQPAVARGPPAGHRAGVRRHPPAPGARPPRRRLPAPTRRPAHPGRAAGRGLPARRAAAPRPTPRCSATVDATRGPARKLVNAVLRRLAERLAQGPPRWPDEATRLSYPDWLVARLDGRPRAPSRRWRALEAMNRSAPRRRAGRRLHPGPGLPVGGRAGRRRARASGWPTSAPRRAARRPLLAERGRRRSPRVDLQPRPGRARWRPTGGGCGSSGWPPSSADGRRPPLRPGVVRPGPGRRALQRPRRPAAAPRRPLARRAGRRERLVAAAAGNCSPRRRSCSRPAGCSSTACARSTGPRRSRSTRRSPPPAPTSGACPPHAAPWRPHGGAGCSCPRRPAPTACTFCACSGPTPGRQAEP